MREDHKRLLVHDMSGHPFQVQLSRELAERGHDVTHVYCASFDGPKGSLEVGPDDPDGLRIEGIRLAGGFAKYSFVKRAIQEARYGWQVAKRLRRSKADCIISSNTPLVAGAVIQISSLALRVPVVFWLQDTYGPAMAAIMKERSQFLGRVVGAVACRVERAQLRMSDSVVVITDDFRPVVAKWGVDPERVEAIENWAPLAELPVRPKSNPWAAKHGLEDKTVFLYSGTLGLKHDPSLMWDLAEKFEHRDDVAVVVASEGHGMDWLREQAATHGGGPILLGFQDYEDLPDMFGAADVLVAVLEPDASAFSVPSKILSYHCAGRPVLASVLDDNLAARIINRENSGVVVEPGTRHDFLAAADKLVDDQGLRETLGVNARSYAERKFDISAIGDRFSMLVARATGGRR